MAAQWRALLLIIVFVGLAGMPTAARSGERGADQIPGYAI